MQWEMQWESLIIMKAGKGESGKEDNGVQKRKTYPRLRLVILLERDFMSPGPPLADCSASVAAAGAGAGVAGVESGVDIA
jgi:hypothetical protein